MLTAIPRMEGLPLLGNLLDFRFRRLEFFLRAAQECGDVARFYAGPYIVVLINTSKYAHAVLVEHDTQLERTRVLGGFLQGVLGLGLLTSEFELHAQQRKRVAPMLVHRRVMGYTAMMISCAQTLPATWKDGATIDVAQAMMKATLAIAGEALFGSNMREHADTISTAFTTAIRHANHKINTLTRIPLTWPTPGNIHFRRAVARLDTILYQLIRERRAAVNEADDLLSLLLRAEGEDGSTMSDQQVRDEAITLLFASHETTANALTWTLYLLAQHPAIYTRMREEVDQMLAGRPITPADLPNLPYTLQVLKEAMRLYPPVYVLGRETSAPIQFGPYELPADIPLALSPYVLHRQPDIFPDPERFDPDRFTSEAEARRARYAYLPFGAGGRSCLGQHFALVKAQILLATLTQQVMFELVLGQQIVPEPLITLRPRGGIRMIVRRRELAHTV